MYQEQIEQIFSKRNRRQIILADFESKNGYEDIMNKAIQILTLHFARTSEIASKEARLRHMQENFASDEKKRKLVESIFIGIATSYTGIPLVSLCAMMANSIPMPKEQAIQTLAEIMGVLIPLGTFKVYRNDKQQAVVRSLIKPSPETEVELNNLMYLPPMISEPRIINKNRDSYHYSLEPESMILGERENFHNGNIGLDVLNRLSQQSLTVDIDFVKEFQPVQSQKHKKEVVNKELEQINSNWQLYLKQLNYVYNLIENQEIFLTHKVDKRGRIYSQGYHLNTQGDDYHKAVLELSNKEIVLIDDPQILPEPVKLNGTSSYLSKDQAKSNKANKFIGLGGRGSSTEQYAKDWADKANLLEYEHTDIVFVSINGKRPNRVGVSAIKPMLLAAIEAKATIITDGKEDRLRPYNVGEREVADYLTSNNYIEDNGTWTYSTRTKL